jgi:hypothetical protein
MVGLQEKCPNCETILVGEFCYACGQKQIEPHERTFKYIVTQFLGSAFNLENNFLKNLWLVVAKPGFLAREYVEGRKKKYMAPFSIFLLINFLYFIFPPITDFNLSLRDQVTIQVHSPIAKKLVDRKLQQEKMTFEAYENKYWNWTVDLSKSLIILNVPITAFFLTLWFRTKFYFADHFIYSLYFYAFIFLFSLIFFNLFNEHIFQDYDWIAFLIFPVFVLLYVWLSVKHFYQVTSAGKLILSTVAMIFILIVTQIFYRAILFFATYLIT